MDFERAEDSGIQAVFEKFAPEISMDAATFKAEWKKYAQIFFDRYSAGKLNFDEQRKMRVAKIFELNGSFLSEKEIQDRFGLYWKTYEKCYGLFPDAKPALEKLKSLGAKLGVITNGDSANQHGKLRRAGVENFFDVVVVSSEENCSKPDLRIFEIALKKAGSSAAETWYTGDSQEHDIIPSRKMGINTLYLNRNRKNPLKVETDGGIIYAEIKDFFELVEIVESKL
jgi:putative hydrolase of the HAD superfamily